jgi:membrane protein YqaA with SNARE-associated domain
MFKRLYEWTLKLSTSKHAELALALVAFAESSFFPLPPDLILVPMALAEPKKAWRYAALCTVASVAGGALGYALGALAYDTIGQWLIHLYGYEEKMAAMRDFYAQWGAVFILVKGLTPIPFKLVTIFSGLFGYNFPLFILLALITRGGRFFLAAAALNHFGDHIRAKLEEHFGLFLGSLTAIVVGGFVIAVKLF